jgi:hypothetical protein
MPSPLKRRPGWAAVTLLGLLLVLGAWRFATPAEPTYQDRTLSQWLYPTEPDFAWIPNDLYGHIHDEFLEQLGSRAPWPPVQASRSLEPPGSNTPTAAVRAMGTNALPWLIAWMASRPRPVERLRGFVDRRFALPRFRPGGLPPVERRHVAAFEGFVALGERAEPALPALSNLLYRPNPDLQLAWAIASLGPRGIAVLTNALTGGREDVRDLAALSLGLEGPAAGSAVPVLLTLIDRGEASYHVLGAVGRIGAEPREVAPPLMRHLERIVAGDADDPCSMTILLLGLCGEAARPAVPHLLTLHQRAAPAERALIRQALLRIDPLAAVQLPEEGRAGSELKPDSE